MLRTACAAVLLLVLTGCTSGGSAGEPTAQEVKKEAATPELGACRLLTPADVAKSSNESPVVPCAEKHTAETFAVGSFPAALADVDPDDPRLGKHVFGQCQTKFRKFLGGNDSLVLRSTVTWAWFRPTTEAWKSGASWYRCDVLGGGEQAKEYVPLPRTAKGVLLGRPEDRWLVCVDGPSVTGSVKIPCSEPHTWRAVTTIVLGKATDPYPGDRLVEVRTRDFCSDSVGAWMNYPVDYDYGFTWFHEAEWKTGNRRSICWAKTDQ